MYSTRSTNIKKICTFRLDDTRTVLRTSSFLKPCGVNISGSAFTSCTKVKAMFNLVEEITRRCGVALTATIGLTVVDSRLENVVCRKQKSSDW